MTQKIKESNITDGAVTSDKLDANAVTSAKLTYPLTTFSSTGIDDNATSTAITIDSSENVGIGTTTIPEILTVNKSSDGAIVGVSINNDYPTTSTASSGTGSGIRFGVNDGQFTSAFGDVRGSEILSVTTSTNGRSRDIVFKSDSGGTLGEKMRILAGGGITFNGDTAAANALDDYEEGTWTPSASTGITGLSVTNATYTKIGRSVTVYAEVAGFSGASSSQLKIAGLPFTPIAASGYAQGVCESDGGSVGIARSDNTTGRVIFFRSDGSSSALRTGFSGNNLGGGLRFSLTYFTS